jgi:hypothetical protein
LHLPSSGAYSRVLKTCTLLLVLVVSVICLSSTVSSSASKIVQQSAAQPRGLLPGQQIWKRGVSSFVFGTNDTQEWYHNNVQTNSGIQQALKDAHFSLMRTFFFDRSLADNHLTTDGEIEQRLKTIENSGMSCLGVLANPLNTDFATHVVRYAGKRCLLYELGNEPDAAGIGSAEYLKQWNRVIPLLRHINPEAKFIGPVVGVDNYLKDFLVGVKQSRVLPDAVSFHWYPCWHDIEEICLSKADEVAEKVLTVRAWVKAILGKELPVGVTEWNFDPGSPTASYGDDAEFMTRFTIEVLLALIQSGATFACQFDAASATVYHDMFDYQTSQPKPQYYALKSLIQQYRS